MTQVFKHLGALLAASSAVLAFAPSASAIIANLNPGDFSTTTPTTVGTATGGVPIDDQAAPDGFGFAFSDPFLLLGAAPTDTDIPGDSLNNANSVATSSTFFLSPSNLSNGTRIKFNWAFQGNSTGDSLFSDEDNFSIVLLNTGAPQAASIFSREADDFGSGSESIFIDSTSGTGLTSGVYRLRITLNENDDIFGNSTAAGFNQISVTAVPFEFSPAMGLLAVGGLFGGSSILKRRKAASKVDLK